jgi:hypothetical protein
MLLGDVRHVPQPIVAQTEPIARSAACTPLQP